MQALRPVVIAALATLSCSVQAAGFAPRFHLSRRMLVELARSR